MRKRRQERRRIRRLKIRTLFMLSLTLIFNAYAWFLYVTTVSSNMIVHVESWSINFTVDDEAVEKEIMFNVEAAYPGMETVGRTVEVSNNGEKVADIQYIITKARILETTYVVPDELSQEDIDDLTGDEIELTKEELVDMLENDFPFTLTLYCSDSSLESGGEATLSFNFSWPYGDQNTAAEDAEDTVYGVGSYEYYEQHGYFQPAIQIKIKMIVRQHKTTT